VRFVEEQFAVCMSKETVRSILLQNGFSSRKGQRRTAGYNFDLDGLIELYEKDLERFWGLGIKDVPPERLT
jgi:hypothetical protein